MPEESVGEVAELYLGNLLYAIERCALSLDADAKPLDAAFYRGIVCYDHYFAATHACDARHHAGARRLILIKAVSR